MQKKKFNLGTTLRDAAGSIISAEGRGVSKILDATGIKTHEQLISADRSKLIDETSVLGHLVKTKTRAIGNYSKVPKQDPIAPVEGVTANITPLKKKKKKI